LFIMPMRQVRRRSSKLRAKVSQPRRVIDPPPQLSCDQIVETHPRILQPFRGEVIIVVAVDDVALETRIRDAGPALQILGKGQRDLVNIGQMFIMVISAAGVVAISLGSRDYNESRFLQGSDECLAYRPAALAARLQTQRAAVPRRDVRGAHGRRHIASIAPIKS
jgi:hypothetical protein